MGWLSDFVSNPVNAVVNAVNDVVVNPVVDTVGDIYMDVRDPLQAAGVVVGNYYFPASSIITSKLVSDGAKEQLNTPEFRLANLGAGAYGAYDGNFANYGFNSPSEAEAAYKADVESVTGASAPDNIDIGGGWSPASGATADELVKAKALMNTSGLTFKQALDGVRAGLLVNSLTGDPLGLAGSGQAQGGAGQSGFAQVPIPEEWQSPTYAASSAPIDLESIFSNQNMLGGTQWQNLPNQQNLSFNDIFAAGQQQTPMGTPVDINQIVSSILGQTATS